MNSENRESSQKEIKMASLQIPLGIDSLEIIAQSVDEKGNIVIDVKSTKNPMQKVRKIDT